jgi:hypothetical protein
MRRFVFMSVVAICFAAAGALLAKTPDGQPPSTETGCATLSGSARGLCNAYCEAQDCDVHPRPSCERLRTQFQRASGQSTFPCDRVACGDAAAPTCDGDCPNDEVCVSGPEAGGTDASGPEAPVGCVCAPPRPACVDAAGPTCDGDCPTGEVCVSGAEAGGPETGGPEVPVGCVCARERPACGDAAAPTCDGGCPTDTVCVSGPEGGGPEGITLCVCAAQG